MKTQKSRNSIQPEKDYSSVCHQQGRMLTDSDLTEQALIARDRLSMALRDVIGTGTPRHDGLLALDEATQEVKLQWGRAYVDGVRCEVRPDAEAGGGFDYEHQLHYPDPPDLPVGKPHRLYLDVWERSVNWLEDEMLRDPGLHGADTTTRTQTMGQVKWCGPETDPLCPDINPAIGDARLHLQLRNFATSVDECDPCKEKLSLTDPVGNFLFRVEVHDVVYDENEQPAEVVLKWSTENGAEAYQASDVPPDFANNEHIYEGFETATEKYLGNHLARGGSGRLVDGSRAELNDFDSIKTSGATFVRRWNGWCRAVKSGSNWKVAEGSEGSILLSGSIAAGTPGHATNDGGTIAIELMVITLSLELDNHPVIAGDYWTVPVRQSVHQEGDILLSSETDNKLGAPPEGELHHYMLLADVASNGSMTLPSGSECDPYNACTPAKFPSLTDLQAKDVCYSQPDCSSPSMQNLLAGQVAALKNDRLKLDRLLDAILCNSSATTLPIDKEGELCDMLSGPEVVTVQDALNVLCANENEGCATFTVAPSSTWFRVFDEIGPGQNAHICFLEGNYVVSSRLIVKGKGHIKMTSAGEGSRFLYSKNEAVITFQDCKSVTIDDGYFAAGTSGAGSPTSNTFDHLNGALTFRGCGEVNLRRVALRCEAATRLFASCLTVENDPQKPGRVRIRECRAEVGHQQVGFLLLNQERVTVEDNLLVVRKKPRGFSVTDMLKDHEVAARVRDLLVSRAVIRDFPELDRVKGLQDIKLNKAAGNRRVLMQSPIGGSHWKRLLAATNPRKRYASNNELLDTIKAVAVQVLRDPALLARHSAIARWVADLDTQNPAVMRQGIVCGGSSMKEIRILNNTITGVLMGIQIGVSDHRKAVRFNYLVGRTRVEGNSVHVLVSPLADRRRGGLFVGNVSQLTVHDNSVRVQRFKATNKVRIESIRVYGILGRKMIIKDNFSADCDVGARITPLQFNKDVSRQWLVADNMFADASTPVQAPNYVQRRNNQA